MNLVTQICTHKPTPAYDVSHVAKVDLPVNQQAQACPLQANVQPMTLREQSGWWRLGWMEIFLK